jgi:hypothetical protein
MKIAMIVAAIALCYTGNNTTKETTDLENAQWVQGLMNILTAVKYETPSVTRCDS